MSSLLQRYEILLPLRYNDGQPVPDDLERFQQIDVWITTHPIEVLPVFQRAAAFDAARFRRLAMAFLTRSDRPLETNIARTKPTSYRRKLKPGRALSSSGRSGCWKNEPICRIIALLAAFFSTANVTNAKLIAL